MGPTHLPGPQPVSPWARTLERWPAVPVPPDRHTAPALPSGPLSAPWPWSRSRSSLPGKCAPRNATESPLPIPTFFSPHANLAMSRNLKIKNLKYLG
ncbi:unnamed protein product, partial [Nesidiocoris tenuis]